MNSVMNEGFNADSRETSSDGAENSVSSPIFSAEVRPGTGDGAVNSVISGPNDSHNEVSKEDGADNTVSSILFSLNSLDPADIEDNVENGRNVSVPDPDNTVTASNNEGCDSEATVTLSVNGKIENDKVLTKPTVPEEEKSIEVKSVKKRLGVTGPERKKLILKIALKDISPHIGKQVEPNASFTIETDKDKNSNVLLSYACNKCKCIFFTMPGYEMHMFHEH